MPVTRLQRADRPIFASSPGVPATVYDSTVESAGANDARASPPDIEVKERKRRLDLFSRRGGRGTGTTIGCSLPIRLGRHPCPASPSSCSWCHGGAPDPLE